MKATIKGTMLIAIGLFCVVHSLNYAAMIEYLGNVKEEELESMIHSKYPYANADQKGEILAHMQVIIGNIQVRLILMDNLCKLKKDFEEQVNKDVEDHINIIRNKSLTKESFKIGSTTIEVNNKYLDDIKVQKEIKGQRCLIESHKIESDIMQTDTDLDLELEKIAFIVKGISTHKIKRRKRSRLYLMEDLFEYVGLDKYIKGTIFNTEGRRAILLITALGVIFLLLWGFISIIAWLFAHLLTVLIIGAVIGITKFLWDH